eukprot:scaffold168746_cov19-Tisochrysis_lutea.AAC.3
MRVEAAGNLLAQDRFVVEQCIKFAHAMPVFLEQYIKFADTRLVCHGAVYQVCSNKIFFLNIELLEACRTRPQAGLSGAEI